jgi:hypothetical protein
MKTKHLALLTGGIIVLAGVAIAFSGWQQARKHAVLSCIMSVHQGIHNLNLSQKEFPNVKSEWTVLDESKSARIILAASKIHPFDCLSVQSDAPNLDYWGRSVQIGVRTSPDGKLEFRVWSKGRDGESGTSDDLVSPYGEKAIISK